MEGIYLASSDWLNFMYPNVHLLLRGEMLSLYNPPWTLFPLIPFAVFPLGRILMLVVAFVSFGFVAIRMGAKPLALAAFLLSPVVYNCLMWGNVEWLSVLGLAINPAIGLLLLAVKPQMMFAVMAFIVIERYRSRGWRGAFKIGLPLAALFTLSLVFFGLWPVHTFSYVGFRDSAFDLNLFPYSVPFGILLFALSLRTHRVHYALAASPLFLPVASPQIWVVSFLALVADTPAMVTASLAYWFVIAVT